MKDAAPPERRPFRWRNCHADIAAAQHDQTVLNYVTEVIRPAVATLDRRIEELEQSDAAARLFYQSDLEDVRRETLMAFALAVQSIWERQFRQYVLGCARELADVAVNEDAVRKADWPKLRRLFHALRGIELEAFPSFEQLDILQLLGNACRHGDGKAAVELWDRRPSLWRPRHEPIFPGIPIDTGPQSVSEIDLKVENLERFASAIASFWQDATYIYNESIERKHESLQKALIMERATRTWLP